MNYPLPYWYQFTVSGPTLPDFYWNVKSQEERIKKICEDLWKLIQVYKLLVDAINDHEERIQYLEEKVRELEERINDLYEKYTALVNRINNIEIRVEAIETEINNINERINNLINDLPNIIKNLIINNEEIRQAIENIVNDLIQNKMDKVSGAVENNVATFDNAGQVKDSGINLDSKMDKAAPNYSMSRLATIGQDGNVQLLDAYVCNRNVYGVTQVTDNLAFCSYDNYLNTNLLQNNLFNNSVGNIDQIFKNNYHCSKIISYYDTKSKEYKFITITIGNKNFVCKQIMYFTTLPDTTATNAPYIILALIDDQENHKYLAYSIGDNHSELDTKTLSQLTWNLLNHVYIETTTEEAAKTLSSSLSNALVYIPEKEEEVGGQT